MLIEWHEAVGDECPQPVPFDVKLLRRSLIKEEFDEVIQALHYHERTIHPEDPKHLAHVAKELADLVYVVYGTAWAYNIPLEDVLSEVHRSNMTKIIGGVQRRDDNKVLKGPQYEEANIERVLSAD